MSANQAKQLAEIYLGLVWQSRPIFHAPLPPKYIWLIPTDVVIIQEAGVNHQVLITELTCGDNIVELQGCGDKESLYYSEAIGEVIPPGNDEVDFSGPSYWQLLDLPPLINTHDLAGCYMISGALGSDWGGCNVYVDMDSHVSR